MNAVEAYEAVNQMLKLVKQAPIPMPQHGTERDKIQFLFDTYVAKLKQEFPQYRKIQDNRLMPELIVQRLAVLLDQMK